MYGWRVVHFIKRSELEFRNVAIAAEFVDLIRRYHLIVPASDHASSYLNQIVSLETETDQNLERNFNDLNVLNTGAHENWQYYCQRCEEPLRFVTDIRAKLPELAVVQPRDMNRAEASRIERIELSTNIRDDMRRPWKSCLLNMARAKAELDVITQILSYEKNKVMDQLLLVRTTERY